MGATVNKYGDLVCPHCGTNMITPGGMMIVPGEGKCPVCGEVFRVTIEIATKANELTERK